MLTKLVRTKIRIPDQQMLRDRQEEARKEKIKQEDLLKRRIMNLFPIKEEITEGILRVAKREDGRYCVGALTLKKALEKNDINSKNVGWGDIKGFIHPYFHVTTKEGVDMEKVDKPSSVTFILI